MRLSMSVQNKKKFGFAMFIKLALFCAFMTITSIVQTLLIAYTPFDIISGYSVPGSSIVTLSNFLLSFADNPNRANL